MHLMSIIYDCFELESATKVYDDPKDSMIEIITIQESRDDCLDAIRDEVIERFGTFGMSSVKKITTDKELKGYMKYNTIVFPMNKEKFDLFEAGEL